MILELKRVWIMAIVFGLLSGLMFPVLIDQPMIKAEALTIFTETQITTNAVDQIHPGIRDNIIVWQDFRNYPDNRHIFSDIYAYNLSSRKETRITESPVCPGFPVVGGNTIIWINGVVNNVIDRFHIYAYDLLTKTETRITTDAAMPEIADISGNTIVWSDYRNGKADVYAYNLLSHMEMQITTNPEFQDNPTISGNIIVWEDSRNGNTDVYAYDMSTNTETQITTNPANQKAPDISGNIIVWLDDRNENTEVYAYDLLTKTETRITTDLVDQWCVAISGNTIIWQDFDTNEYTYAYDLTTKTKTLVTTTGSGNIPAVSGNTIVWADFRNGNSDIYARLSSDLTVISPNGGQNWARDTPHTLTWSSTGSSGVFVKIELLKSGIVDSTISSSTANNGSYTWTIPSKQAVGTDYSVMITSIAYPSINDSSNSNFAITSGTSASTISCSISKSSVPLGTSVTILGFLTPAVSNANITLTYTKPDSTVLYRTVTSTANGSYSDRYFPDRIGPWTVKASWEGDQTSDKAVSVSISFYLSPYLDHPITFGGATYHLATSSNSSISSLSFNQTQKEIRFTVNGPADTIGYNNITIPKELLSGALVVKIDGNQINPTITQNGTHAFVYCTYAHSLHQVKIVGTTIIPEFPTITSITMLLTILALTLIFTKRKMIRY